MFSATTGNDKIMYVLLIGTFVLGLGTTVLGNLTGHPHDYRDTVSPWFRSIFYPAPRHRPDPGRPPRFPAARRSPPGLLFAFWPFTRLVHVFSAPLGYLTRPYIVYRSRDAQLGSRPTRRGWDRVQ